MRLFTALALRVSMLLLLAATFSYANYFYYDDYINHPPFNEQIETMGQELHAKTNWSAYLVVIEDINNSASNDREKLFAYENEIVSNLQTPYVLMVLAIKQQKVHIIGSEGFKEIFDPNVVLEENVYPLLGSKIKGDDREKYLAAMLNGYGEIVDEIADHYNVKLESSIGDTNKNAINLLRVIFYATILGALGIYAYKRYLKKR